MRWIMLSKNYELTKTVQTAAIKRGYSLDQLTSPYDVKESLNKTQGTVLFIENSSDYDAYEVCRELSSSYPMLSIILLLPSENIDLKTAMYVGAVDVLGTDIDGEELDLAIEKAQDIVKLKSSQVDQEQEKQGKVMTICSTKGGVGKTTITVNLAASLAKGDHKVAIIDLDLQFGDVMILFDKEPKRTIYDWVKESYEESNGDIRPYISSHASGVDILAAPLLPEFAELITGEHVMSAINQLRRHYDFVLVDTPPSLVDTVLVSLEHSDEVLLVASLDIPTLKNIRTAIDTLKLLGLNEKIKVILNRDTEMEGLKVTIAESIISRKIFSRIPSDYKTVVSSLNHGIPFVISHARLPIAKSIYSLANKLSDPSSSTHFSAEEFVKKRKSLKRLLIPR
ncbi:AAA family ATPase [Pseudalkalibacillus caeni]|uniref:AAA domain-containing protein n=1 Tax=Exobacillus caeni TaxID=2574798 RepID=A0A5R9EWZ9_9BACL|nr:AAA family ATPase [Pseudalkalibacillus caeni]TLS35577.1 hypothetical protein FCL54_19655 [Pseudalkalibacillus caeni]